MPLIAEAELTLSSPVDRAFELFIQFPTWKEWMPKQFRPLRGPAGPIKAGDRLLVNITGLPSVLAVERVDASREVCWSGGIPGLLHARHTFYFEADGDRRTRVRSVEPWGGALTSVGQLARPLVRTAARVGRAQLEGFERWLATRG